MENGKVAVRSYTDLVVWQKAMVLVEEVYRVSERFPRAETFGLTGQIRRAAVSVPSNIAEGWGRQSTKAYIQHLSISHGSLCEVETQLRIASRLQYLEEERLHELLAASENIGRPLSRLSAKLERRIGIGKT